MRTFKGLPVAAAILLAAIPLAACAPAGQKAATTAKGDTIEIGVAGPMSGELGAFGEQLRKGAEQAVADINAAGGINGKKLHLNIGDDRCEPRRAVSVANDLVDENVVFVVGHFCSGSSIPASKVYGDDGILQITPSSTNPALTEDAATQGIRTVFRTSGRDDRQAYKVIEWLKSDYAGESVAILDDGTAYGSEIVDVIKAKLVTADFSKAIFRSFSPRQKDFSALAADLKSAGVKAVFVGGYHDEVAPFAKALRAAGSTAAIAGPDALNTSEFWTLAGKAGEGVRLTDGGLDLDLPSAAKVVAAFRQDGFEPEGYTLNTYAAVQAFAAAAKGSGGFDGAKMAAWLRANPVQSVIGEMSWDEKGDLTKVNYVWYVWRDGRMYREP